MENTKLTIPQIFVWYVMVIERQIIVFFFYKMNNKQKLNFLLENRLSTIFCEKDIHDLIHDRAVQNSKSTSSEFRQYLRVYRGIIDFIVTFFLDSAASDFIQERFT